MEDDSKFMRLAIALAKQAEKEGEVPVGAILVRCDEIVASGYNQVKSMTLPRTLKWKP